MLRSEHIVDKVLKLVYFSNNLLLLIINRVSVAGYSLKIWSKK